MFGLFDYFRKPGEVEVPERKVMYWVLLLRKEEFAEETLHHLKNYMRVHKLIKYLNRPRIISYHWGEKVIYIKCPQTVVDKLIKCPGIREAESFRAL